MSENLISKNLIRIKAPVTKVWKALTDPELTKHYLFGASVNSDWKEGSTITFNGEYEGKKFHDKGVILASKPGKLLKYTHWSELSGLPDTPENYHTLIFELTDEGSHTLLTLSQDNNHSEKELEHANKFWINVLATIKSLVEKKEYT